MRGGVDSAKTFTAQRLEAERSLLRVFAEG